VIIVSDTTPLSELAKVGQLNLLRDIFGKVIFQLHILIQQRQKVKYYK
jgi:predicted nucleic acid-binding protein